MTHPANPPIPPPSHLRQYRAIGLIYGQYQRSEDKLTLGNILTLTGTVIDAVILGRLISLTKKHLDLDLPHLWVVYPRTGQEDNRLHVQIGGVWEPQTLHQEPGAELTPPFAISYPPGYFSIRGEVVFSDPQTTAVIVKIRQSPRPGKEQPKFFKLKLQGCLPEQPVSRFWDLQVQLQGDVLVLQSATDLGPIPKKTPNQGKKPALTFSRKVVKKTSLE